MRHTAYILAFVAASTLAGCGPKGVPLEGRSVTRVVIDDYNWELGLTTTFTVETHQVSITDDRGQSPAQVVALSAAQSAQMKSLFNSFDRLHPGHHADEGVADGVIIAFHFHLDDGAVVKTSLSNVMIDSYAKLTEYVSSLVGRDIHYHQYEMKRL